MPLLLPSRGVAMPWLLLASTTPLSRELSRETWMPCELNAAMAAPCASDPLPGNESPLSASIRSSPSPAPALLAPPACHWVFAAFPLGARCAAGGSIRPTNWYPVVAAEGSVGLPGWLSNITIRSCVFPTFATCCCSEEA
eukprot:902789-Prorocentrum_minimum.AAC.2